MKLRLLSQIVIYNKKENNAEIQLSKFHFLRNQNLMDFLLLSEQ